MKELAAVEKKISEYMNEPTANDAVRDILKRLNEKKEKLADWLGQMCVGTISANADKGCYDGKDIADCEQSGTTCYVPETAGYSHAPDTKATSDMMPKTIVIFARKTKL